MLFTITITISISNKLWIEIGVDPLQNEDQHQSLSRAYDEIIEDRELVTVTTRAAAGGELISISSRENLFHTSFLPRTICEMRGEYIN